MANLETAQDNLKQQLALAVTSIQWSYAIFWSVSAGEPGVLEWNDGYYNGDIKTRKTVQSLELNADQLGLQRSEQLRELYDSLSAGEASPEARRPSAALSPEDLTDAEWYYLVCMSFVFDIGQGLPGRTFANGQPSWLCNAHNADSKVFTRSLLAKSAGIKTVVCFPFLRGVVELGVTELVLEDPSLIQDIKTSFLDVPFPIPVNSSGTRSVKELEYSGFNHGIFDNTFVECEGLDVASPSNSSDRHPDEDSFLEGMNQGASQVQNWQFIDDDFGNCVHQLTNPGDCVSHTITDTVVPDEEKLKQDWLQDVQECTRTKFTALDLQQSDDLHYQSVLSCLLRTSHPLILRACLQKCHQESSFVSWGNVGEVSIPRPKVRTPQNLLKKILFEIPRMHVEYLLESRKDRIDKVGVGRPEANEIGPSHVLSERKRREKINQRFMILKSIVPSTSKVDKVSILDDTIEYLQELERRLEELESQRESAELEESTRTKPQDAVERTSDNYCRKRMGSGKRPSASKRRAYEIYMEPDIDRKVAKDGTDIAISVNEEQVVIEIKCPWREGILLDIMDAASHFHLDSHSVQSSTVDGILYLTMKSKNTGPTSASAWTIKQALQRVASKS